MKSIDFTSGFLGLWKWIIIVAIISSYATYNTFQKLQDDKYGLNPIANYPAEAGFSSTMKEWASDVDKASALSESVSVGTGGRLTQYVDPSGVELWQFFPSQGTKATGVSAYYSGETCIPVVLDEQERVGRHPLDTMVQGWVNPGPAGDPEGADYPIIVDLLPLSSSVSIGTTALNVVLFPKEMHYFDSEAEYSESQEGQEVKYASEAFIPTGTFAQEGDKGIVPEAMVSGTILKAEMKTNVVSGKPFWHLVIRTYGGNYDLVARPDRFVTEPKVSGVVNGIFKLTGRILSTQCPSTISDEK